MIDTLYSLYRNGAVEHDGKKSAVLEVAKSIGPGMSRDDFAFVAQQVEKLQSGDVSFDADSRSRYEAIKSKHATVHYSPKRDGEGSTQENRSGQSIAPKVQAALKATAQAAASSSGSDNRWFWEMTDEEVTPHLMKSESGHTRMHSLYQHSQDALAAMVAAEAKKSFPTFSFADSPTLNKSFLGSRSLQQIGQMDDHAAIEASAAQWAESFRKHEERQRDSRVQARLAHIQRQREARQKGTAKQSFLQDAVSDPLDSNFVGPHMRSSGPPPMTEVDGFVGPIQRFQGAPPVQGGGSRTNRLLDMLQMGLDAVGVVEPTPFADLTNAGVSVLRAISDPSNAGGHLKNAAISMVSTIPYLGDLAKLGKSYTIGGKAVSRDGIIEGIKGFTNGRGELVQSLGNAAGAFIGRFGGGGGSDGGDGGGGGAGGSAGGSGGGGIIPVFGKLALGATAVIAGFRLLTGWLERAGRAGEQFLESNRGIARFNGAFESGVMRLDVDRQRRSMERASALGPSLGNLARAQSALEKEQAITRLPKDRLNADIANFLTWARTGLTSLLRNVDPHYWIAVWYESIAGKADNPQRSTMEWMYEAYPLLKKQGTVEITQATKPKLPANRGLA